MMKMYASIGMFLVGLNAVAGSWLKVFDDLNKIGKVEKQCSVQAYPSEGSGWTAIPISEAQCTAGAKSAGHYARVKVSTFSNSSQFAIEAVSPAKANAVQDARKTHPSANYIGNGPIYMDGTNAPNGYVKSGGKVLNPMDCVKFRSNSGNLGKENGVFVRYRPRTASGDLSTSGEWKYRVVSAEFLCNQLQPQPYVDWLQGQLPSGSDVEAELKARKRWEPQDDLVNAGQIDFAIQSGPAVLREGQNLLTGYNSATSFRSYVGVNQQGLPVVVEADGNIGSYCLGEYFKKRGIRDLLHRDSYISDASYRESDGTTSGYPTQNSNAQAASLLMISE